MTVEDIIKNSNYTIKYSPKIAQKKTYLTFDVETKDSDNNKYVLIAVKSPKKTKILDLISLYVSQSSIQPLEFGISHFGFVENKKDVYKLYEVYVPNESNSTDLIEVIP
jgi:hypothetical protein